MNPIGSSRLQYLTSFGKHSRCDIRPQHRFSVFPVIETTLCGYRLRSDALFEQCLHYSEFVHDCIADKTNG